MTLREPSPEATDDHAPHAPDRDDDAVNDQYAAASAQWSAQQAGVAPGAAATAQASPYQAQLAGWSQAQAQGAGASSSNGLPYLEIAPRDVAMGPVLRGDSKRQSVQVTNHEDREVWIADASIEGAPSFSVAGFPAATRLNPGQTLDLDVVFTPAVVTREQGALVLQTAEGHRFTVPVEGTGMARVPRLKLSPQRTDFGAVKVRTPSDRRKLTITNEEREDVTVRIGADHDAFRGEDERGYFLPLQERVLRAGASTTIDVWFYAEQEGDLAGAIHVTTMDGDADFAFDMRARVYTPKADDEGREPEPEPQPEPLQRPRQDAPEPEQVAPVDKPLEVSPSLVSMTTMAGRPTLAQEVRLQNPNEQGAEVEAEIEAKGDGPSPFTVGPPSVWVGKAGSRDEVRDLGVTYAPGAEGKHEATLKLRYAQRTEHVELRGTAMPAREGDKVDGENDVAGLGPEDGVATPLPEAEAPRTRDEAEAMLMLAADSLSSLATVHEARMPHLRTAVESLVDTCGAALGGFHANLVQWMADESATKLGSLMASSGMEMLSYALSIATLPSAAAGIVKDTVMLAWSMNSVADTNASIGEGLANNDFLAGVMSRAASEQDRQVIRMLSQDLLKFGQEEGELREIAGPRAMELLQILSDLVSRPQPKRAADAYGKAQRLLERFQNGMEDAGIAVRSIADLTTRVSTGLPVVLAALKDKYLEFLALGKSERTGEQFAMTMMGNVNFDVPSDGRPFTLHLYPDYLRLVGERTVDPREMSGTMRNHLSSKRLRDLPAVQADGTPGMSSRAGWSASIELASAQGGELVFLQTAQGARDQRISSDAHGHVDRLGGPEVLWAALDEMTLP